MRDGAGAGGEERAGDHTAAETPGKFGRGGLDRADPPQSKPDGPRSEGGQKCEDGGGRCAVGESGGELGGHADGKLQEQTFNLQIASADTAGKGGDNYQKSFYVFEELAQAPSSTSATSLIAQAVSELHMGRLEEAETALNQALTVEPENATALANKVVLDTIVGQHASETRKKLGGLEKENELVTGLEKGREAFRSAMGKYSPKMEP